LSGVYNLKTKNYKDAIFALSKAYDYFSSINDSNQNYALYNIGKSYQGLKNKEKTVRYFVQLDSNIQERNSTSFPELREVYTYLINYYKENNNKEKQLYYIDRFLIIDEKLDEQFKYLSIELPKKYDVPNLLKEKETIISELKTRKFVLYTAIVILSVLMIFLGINFYTVKKAEKNIGRLLKI
jgi:hypothetical protein